MFQLCETGLLVRSGRNVYVQMTSSSGRFHGSKGGSQVMFKSEEEVEVDFTSR